MALEQAEYSGRFEQTMILGQIALAFTAMAVFVFAPRGDEPVALYPMGSEAAKAVPALMSTPQTLILARGNLDGSYVIRGNRPGFLKSLLRNGVLVLNASAPGCGPLPSDYQQANQDERPQ